MKLDSQILISGAGPVGLTLAAFLKQNDVPFRLIDQRSGPVKESRALGVHARTLELLKPLGLDKEFIRLGRITHDMHFHDHKRKLFSLKFDCLESETPYPYYLILPQTTTERVLIRHLAEQGVEVEWNTSLSSFEQFDGHVSCQLTTCYGRKDTKIGQRFPWLKTVQGDSTLDFIDGRNWTLLTFGSEVKDNLTDQEINHLLNGAVKHAHIFENQYFKNSGRQTGSLPCYSMDIPKTWQNKAVLLRPDGYIYAISELKDRAQLVVSLKKWL